MSPNIHTRIRFNIRKRLCELITTFKTKNVVRFVLRKTV